MPFSVLCVQGLSAGGDTGNCKLRRSSCWLDCLTCLGQDQNILALWTPTDQKMSEQVVVCGDVGYLRLYKLARLRIMFLSVDFIAGKRSVCEMVS